MDFSIFLNALTGFFVIIDPIGAALIFHSLIPEKEMHHRKVMAFKAIGISAVLLIVFGNYGEPLLHLLGNLFLLAAIALFTGKHLRPTGKKMGLPVRPGSPGAPRACGQFPRPRPRRSVLPRLP